MTDLDELLHRHAAAWQPPATAAPDLEAALARHGTRRKLLAGGTLIGLVAAAALTAIVLGGQAAPVPAVPDPLATPTAAASTSGPAEPLASRSAVGRAVREQAARYGIAVNASGVQTTWVQAVDFLGVDPGGTAGETDVWVVEVRGEFSCDNCTTTKTGPEASSAVLTLVLDARTLANVHTEGRDRPRNLADLGQVVDFDLAR